MMAIDWLAREEEHPGTIDRWMTDPSWICCTVAIFTKFIQGNGGGDSADGGGQESRQGTEVRDK